MLKRERQAYILQQLNLHNKVLSTSLSEEIEVSEDTIRRDLIELSESGKLIKVHGGALLPSFENRFNRRHSIYAKDAKQIIAQKVIPLIKDGMFILTGGGTTVIELAKELPSELKATFISGSLPVLIEYMQHPNIDVIVLGDKLKKASKITVGADVMNRIKSLKVDLCILGINAIHPVHGITDSDWDVVQVKQQMIASAKKTICMTISEKLNTIQPIHVCPVNMIDTLVTELDPTDELLKPFEEFGINTL